ncbi:MAG: ABC transporter ATP-binding protein [Candidatus Schekmanbacteria bacterium]|nr:ABC transporter ATP-binding protein [Candidatus Schekmanbacteria bacterium]
MKNFLRLKKYFYQYRKSILAGVMCLVLTNLVSLTAPWVLKTAIDQLRQSLTHKRLFYYAALILGISIVQGIFRYLTRQILIGASRHIEYHFRNDITLHLQKLPWSFFIKHKTGDILARTTEDLNAVRMAIGPGIMHFSHTIVLFFVVAGLLFYINPVLAFWALLPLPVFSLYIKKNTKRVYQSFMSVQQKLSALTSHVQENFSGIRIIQAYQREEASIETFQKLGREYIQGNMELARYWGLLLPLMMLIYGLGQIIVLMLGGRQIILGQLSLGEFVAFNAYLAMLLFPMMALGWVMNLFQRGAAAMERISLILDEPEQENRGQLSETPAKGEIEFRHLHFSYETQNKKWALKNINLKIPAGTTLGIVGAVGAGKTTLVNLLPRLLEISQGQILIDNQEIRNIPLKALRSLIGYVPQEGFLFSASIKENILYGFECLIDKCNEEEKIIEAAQISQIWEEIHTLPERFETKLGERGITLSGGQRQRTALARALIRDPKILILDDSFASVDTYTERKILQHLKPFMAGRTCLIISHRISTVMDADRIIVLDEGEIVQQGRHEDLIRNPDGFYAKTYAKQLLLDEITRGNK